MEIGSAQAVSANNPAPAPRTDRTEQPANETDEAQTATSGQVQQPAENQPTQQVQPVAESESAQPTNDATAEPDAGSQEAVGRFIDTVV